MNKRYDYNSFRRSRLNISWQQAPLTLRPISEEPRLKEIRRCFGGFDLDLFMLTYMKYEIGSITLAEICRSLVQFGFRNALWQSHLFFMFTVVFEQNIGSVCRVKKYRLFSRLRAKYLRYVYFYFNV